ncbi:MAG: isoprenylcysteine carboxylmethyltransferase family protein [Weeksellaceae bacterium]
MKEIPTKDAGFVVIQLFLFFAFFFDVRILRLSLPETAHLTGSFLFMMGMGILLIAVLQLNRNLSVFPSPRQGAEFIKSGLYKYIRHPIYTGILTGGMGFALYTDSGFRLLIILLLGVLFYFKSIYEEEKLSDVFRDYKDYKKKTGRFLPKLRF